MKKELNKPLKNKLIKNGNREEITKIINEIKEKIAVYALKEVIYPGSYEQRLSLQIEKYWKYREILDQVIKVNKKNESQ